MKKATLLNQQGWVFQLTFLYSKSQLIHGARFKVFLFKPQVPTVHVSQLSIRFYLPASH